MKIEDQVVSLELSKRLKELGVNQESQFQWWKGVGIAHLMPKDWSQFNMEPKPMYDTADVKESISAFTVAELGEMIPASVKQTTLINNKEDSAHIFFIRYDDDDSDCDGTNPDTCIKTKWHAECGKTKFRELTEADARAKMLIYLLENKLITL